MLSVKLDHKVAHNQSRPTCERYSSVFFCPARFTNDGCAVAHVCDTRTYTVSTWYQFEQNSRFNFIQQDEVAAAVAAASAAAAALSSFRMWVERA